jgi:hypothetical protein
MPQRHRFSRRSPVADEHSTLSTCGFALEDSDVALISHRYVTDRGLSGQSASRPLSRFQYRSLRGVSTRPISPARSARVTDDTSSSRSLSGGGG